ncbi:MAG: A/G-specific adenine glycosylase [Bacteroidia bacterium]
MLDFSRLLIAWYTEYKRDLPWRNSRDPYAIWLSEVILQQTRVAQGLSYYEAFITTFPRVHDLAAAEEQQVLRLWQGLGYYSRARNLHRAAKQLVQEYGGVFPADYESLRKLSGVGPYTAAAIASIAFNLPKAVVDGNVYRVLSRIWGIRTPIDGQAGQKQFADLASQLLDPNRPSEHNQALMEFGALQCVPRNPDCTNCPFAPVCVAHLRNEVSLFPVKAGKTKVRERFFNYVVFRQADGLYLRQRLAGDVWQHLWDVALFEAEKELDEKEILTQIAQKFALKPVDFQLISHSERVKHVLTHQRIFAKFWLVQIFHNLQDKELKFVAVNELNKYPLPRLIEYVFKKHQAWLD